jgi:nucleoid-associated protein YgaU
MYLLALVSIRQREGGDMSIRRLAVTATVMGLIAVLLASVTPGPSALAGALTSPQRTADTAGADALVLAAAGLAAWAVWAWGALGLTLTAASGLPGLAGGAARLALHGVLPAGARRTAALALGLGIGVAAPLLGAGAPALAPHAAAADLSDAGVPDWPAPAGTDGDVPDWPGDPVPDAADRSSVAHVVVPGDCLWHIASARLRDTHGTPPADGEVATAVEAWWAVNRSVIGADPDLLLPGQVLKPPDPAA